MKPIHLLALASSLSLTSAQNQAPICEDSIDSQPPFNNNNIPCLLGCGTPIARPTLSYTPGWVNLTDIPYCRLNCVRREGVTPAQSSAAPACNQRCEQRNAATPDQLGWCMYWCVEGGAIESMVVSTTCVPSLQYTPISTTYYTQYYGSGTESVIAQTIEGFTMPTQWASWYQTQTVIPKTSPLYFAPTPETTSTTTSSEPDIWGYQTLTPTCGGGSGYHLGVPCSDSSSPTRAHLFSSTTATSTPVTGDAQAQSESQRTSTQTASTSTPGGGATEVRPSQWIFQALLAVVLAFV